MDSSRQATSPGKESDASAMGVRFREAYCKTPLRAAVATIALNFYKTLVGPALQSLGGVGLGCRYPQTCSEYAALSILEKGVLRGGWRAALRVCSCNPWMEPCPQLMTAECKEAS